MTPSQGSSPRSSPPTDHATSTMRPSVELAATRSFTARATVSPAVASSVGRSIRSYSPRKSRFRPSSRWLRGIEVRKPTAPKLTPATGIPVPRKRPSVRSIVPSPPRTSAMSASGMPSPASSTSSTPACAASSRTRGTASATVSRRPCRTSAAFSTALPDGVLDPAVDLVCKLRLLAVDEVEEELPIPLWPGQSRVYDPTGLGPPAERRLDGLAEDAGMDGGVADNAFRRIAAAGLELRLDQHDRLPAGAREGERRRQRLVDADEGHVCDDEVRRVRQLGDLAGVRPLEHGDPRIFADPGVQLSVADVERDHARCPALEQDVGEAAGRGAEVQGVTVRGVDPERVEAVCELLAAARDEARRALHLERGVLGELLAGLRMAGHKTGKNERLRLGASLREPALDQEHVEPFLHAAEASGTLRHELGTNPSQMRDLQTASLPVGAPGVPLGVVGRVPLRSSQWSCVASRSSCARFGWTTWRGSRSSLRTPTSVAGGRISTRRT